MMRRNRVITISVLLVVDVVVTTLITSTSGVFTAETFNIKEAANGRFIQDGRIGFVRFTVLILVCF